MSTAERSIEIFEIRPNEEATNIVTLYPENVAIQGLEAAIPRNCVDRKRVDTSEILTDDWKSSFYDHRHANRFGGNVTSDFSEDSIKIFLRQVRNVPIPKTRDQQAALFIKLDYAREAHGRLLDGTEFDTTDAIQTIREGHAARNHLILGNVGLIVRLAKNRPLPPGFEFSDLIQEGTIAIEHAVDKFDWKKGYLFSTYANWWLKQRLDRTASRGALVSVNANRFREMTARLYGELDGDETLLGSTERALYYASIPSSLDFEIGDDTTFGDQLESTGCVEEEAESNLHVQTITDLVSQLSPLEIKLVGLRMTEGTRKPMGYQRIADSLGISAHKAKKIHQDALSKLRSAFVEQGIVQDYSEEV